LIVGLEPCTWQASGEVGAGARSAGRLEGEPGLGSITRTLLEGLAGTAAVPASVFTTLEMEVTGGTRGAATRDGASGEELAEAKKEAKGSIGIDGAPKLSPTPLLTTFWGLPVTG